MLATWAEGWRRRRLRENALPRNDFCLTTPQAPSTTSWSPSLPEGGNRYVHLTYKLQFIKQKMESKILSILKILKQSLLKAGIPFSGVRVSDHSFGDLFSSHENYHLLCSRYCGIEKIFGQKHGGRAVKRNDNDRILTSLTLMHGYRIGVLELVEIGKFIRYVSVIENYLHTFVESVDTQYSSYISVEYSRACLIILATPLDFIIVFDLHHLVTLAKNSFTVLVFPSFCGRRVQCRLEHYVEVFGTCISLSRGRNDLDICHGLGSVGPWQAVFMKIGYGKRDLLIGISSEEEKVAVFNVKSRNFSAVYGVRIGYYQGLLRLAEDLIEAYGGKSAAFEKVAEHVSCSNAGKLVSVSYQYHSCSGLDRAQKG